MKIGAGGINLRSSGNFDDVLPRIDRDRQESGELLAPLHSFSSYVPMTSVSPLPSTSLRLILLRPMFFRGQSYRMSASLFEFRDERSSTILVIYLRQLSYTLNVWISLCFWNKTEVSLRLAKEDTGGTYGGFDVDWRSYLVRRRKNGWVKER